MSIRQLLDRIRAKLKEWLDRQKPVDLPPADDDPMPTPTPGAWKVTQIYSAKDRWFPVFARWWRGKVIVSWFNRATKRNSKLEADGKEIYRGADETMGPIGEHNDRYYFCGETSDRVHYVDSNHNVFDAAKYGDDAKWNIYGTIWQGIPVFGGHTNANKNNKSVVLSAIDGRRLWTLPLNGLIAGLCEDSMGRLWAACSWDETGVCSSEGHLLRGISAASIACVGDNLYAGDMRSGAIWQLYPSDGGSIAYHKVLDVNASKVLRMYAHEGKLLIAAANHDTFAIYDPITRTLETIVRFDDEAAIPPGNGTQFDVDIAPHPDGYLLCRAVDRANTGHVYLAERI